MQASDDKQPSDGLSVALGILTRIVSAFGSIVEGRLGQLAIFQRREILRMASIFALMFTAAVFACAATGFAAFALLMALSPEHRAAACGCIAVGFALLTALAVLLARGSGRGGQ
ncbi:MAG: hypothetical protein ABSF96_14770 [Steroidobacteraceae bacterium]|jgi:hypothetical protein